jgi:hypothetical protein
MFGVGQGKGSGTLCQPLFTGTARVCISPWSDLSARDCTRQSAGGSVPCDPDTKGTSIPSERVGYDLADKGHWEKCATEARGMEAM